MDVACVLVIGVLSLHTGSARDSDSTATAPQRPAILFNRWQEDWSVLADPRVRREPFDNLKYIPLSRDNPKAYLSLGADLRVRFESNNAPALGTPPNVNEDYVITRFELHADVHPSARVQIFTQLQSDFAPGKVMLTPPDVNQLDLEQAFVAVTEPVGGGTFTARVGRQQIAFDLQRFISLRDGPNVRQSFDAAWFSYLHGAWRLSGFYSQPVQDKDVHVFDDYSSQALTYGGVRLEHQVFGSGQLSATLSRFTQHGAHFPSISGNERRDVLDVHFAQKAGGFDLDMEGMGQTGRIADENILAWAVGSLGGYTIRSVRWTPRLGMQLDAASGDSDPHDHTLGTFNPLFPNGYYLALAGYTGYTNFIHVKPSITVYPTSTLTVLLASAGVWRETTADAILYDSRHPYPWHGWPTGEL